MGNALRIGVLGVGRIGEMHAGIISRQTSGAVLAGVADALPAAASRVARNLGVEVFAAADLIASPDVDAIAVCTSTDTHVDLIIAAAAAGKAIFCEKPVSLDAGEVDRALAAVDAAGVPLMVGFNRRFDPGHRAVRDAVASGAVGDVRIVRITSRDPAPPPIDYIKVSGGMFMDMTIHDFDMARFIVDSPIVEVFATGQVLVDPAIGLAGDIDTAVVVLKHENGATTVIDNCRQAAYGYDQRVEAFGSAGMALSDNHRQNHAAVYDSEGVNSSNLPYFFLDRYVPSYVNEWAAFVEYVRDGGPSPVPGSAGRAPVVLAQAAWRSVREGRPILVDGV
jgi:myo-inositol 2-dehydrogenase / D-chiro-inositol 1-dehydrogenase